VIVIGVVGGLVVLFFLLILVTKAGGRSRNRAVIKKMNSKAFRRQQLRAMEIQESINAEYQRRKNGGKS
jgi:hypothetical protein